MSTDYVIQEPYEAPPATLEPEIPDGEEATPDPKELLQRINSYERQLEQEAKLRQQADEKAQFWYGKSVEQIEAIQNRLASQQTPAQAAPEEVRFEIDSEINDLVPPEYTQAIAREVDRLVEKKLSRRKFATLDDVSNVVNATAQELTEFEKLRQTYPDLNNPQSEMFLATQRHAQEMQRDSRFSGLPPMLIAQRAIEKAELEMLRAGKLGTQQQEPEPQQQQQQFAPRQQRIAAQAGSRGVRPTAPATNTAQGQFASEPPERQAAIMKVVRGFGMTLEQYYKQAPQAGGAR